MRTSRPDGHVRKGPLSAEQVERFALDGVLVVPGLLTAEETGAVRAWTDEVQAWEEVPGRHMMYFDETDSGRLLNRVENFAPYHQGFRRLMAAPPLLGAVGQLLREPAVLFKDKINFKLPGGGGFDAHQDAQAGWTAYASLHVTVLVAVDRATVENGCLEIARGFASNGLVGSEWKPLTGEELAGVELVPLEMEPGDGAFFDSFVPHRSEPNRSAVSRRVLYCTYNRASEGDQRERYYKDKRASYPPDVEREPGKEYRFRV